MAAARKIVVFGVTGVQGASVAKALLADTQNKWDVVGITRDPASRGSKGTSGRLAVVPPISCRADHAQPSPTSVSLWPRATSTIRRLMPRPWLVRTARSSTPTVSGRGTHMARELTLARTVWATYKGDSAPAKATEIRQSSGAVDAALAAGVKHIVYSALEHFPDQELPHFDSKAEGECASAA